MTITERIQKPMPGTEPKGEPVEAKGWRNLIFTKNGKSYVGINEFPTAEAAAERISLVLGDKYPAMIVTGGPMQGRDPDGNPTRCIFKSDYSSAFQIPWVRA
jgi:hypothetical protein